VKMVWGRLVLPALIAALAAAGAAWAQGGVPVDMEFEGAGLADVVRVLGELGGYNVIVDPSVQGSVTFRLRGMTVDEAIEMVVRTSGYSYRRLGSTLVVGAESTLRARFDVVDTKVLQLEYADPSQLLPLIRLLFPNIEAQVDTVQRALVVRGLSAEVARAEAFVRERDVRPLVEQEFVQAPVVEILRTLARLGGYNLIAQGEIAGTMTVSLSKVTVESAIELVARRAGLAYEIDGTELVVSGRPASEGEDAGTATAVSVPPPVERRLIQLVHISPSRILDAVRVLVGGGDVWADEASRTMIVSATVSALRQIEELVALLDVPAVAVRGVLRQGEERLAIIQIGQANHIVRAGDSVAGVKVLAVDLDGVMVETVHGHRLSVRAGGN